MTRLWTVGHSTRTQEQLISLLEQNGIQTLADVRRYPMSRRHPQFNCDALAYVLKAVGIDYVWMQDLGGRRTPRKDSPNTAWRNAGFRGYADYMETPAFQGAADALMRCAQAGSTAILCAEQAWQQCHRGLVADYLKADGVDVVHIIDARRNESHPWTAAARVVNGRLSYSAGAEDGQQRLDL